LQHKEQSIGFMLMQIQMGDAYAHEWIAGFGVVASQLLQASLKMIGSQHLACMDGKSAVKHFGGKWAAVFKNHGVECNARTCFDPEAVGSLAQTGQVKAFLLELY